jgi:hypothetical protein
MIVSRARYFKEVCFRYRPQIMMSILGLTMIIMGILDTPLVTSYYTISEGARLASQAYGSGVVLIIFGILGIVSTFRILGSFAGGIMTLGIVIHFIIFTAIMFPDLVVDPASTGALGVEPGAIEPGATDPDIYVDPEPEPDPEDDDGGDINYIIRLIFFLLEGFCIFFAIKMIMGSTHNTSRVVIVELLFIAIFMVVLFVNIHRGLSFVESMDQLNDYHSSIILMVVSVICLSMGDAKYISPMKRLRLNVLALETTTVTFSDMYMMRDSLQALVTEDPSKWNDSAEPEIEKELDITMYNTARRERLVIRKWADGALTATFKPRDLEVHLYRYLNFPIRHIACPGGPEQCGRVRLYGKEGFFVDILVRDEHIRKYRPVEQILAPVLWLRDKISPKRELTAEGEVEEFNEE